jgi:hypothetical protein
MNYENFKTGFNKPTKFTAENYGTKISVEIDHSDLDLDEVMDAFETLIIGMGYHADSLKSWVIDRADEYKETEAEFIKEKLNEWHDEEEDIVFHKRLKKNDESIDELENDFFGQYDTNIGDEDNYRATDEDASEFDDYGKTISADKDIVWNWDETEDTNEWGSEPEEDDNLFEGDEWEANDKLKAANERYKKEVKKMTAKQKKVVKTNGI